MGISIDKVPKYVGVQVCSFSTVKRRICIAYSPAHILYFSREFVVLCTSTFKNVQLPAVHTKDIRLIRDSEWCGDTIVHLLGSRLQFLKQALIIPMNAILITQLHKGASYLLQEVEEALGAYMPKVLPASFVVNASMHNQLSAKWYGVCTEFMYSSITTSFDNKC